MKREEEIREAINKHFPCTNGGRCYEQSLGASGFELGVQWADQHPKNIWHDANEEPELWSDIVVIDRKGQWRDVRPYKGNGYYWCELMGCRCCVAELKDAQKWAYIKDLL